MNVSIENLEFPCEIKTKFLKHINKKINAEFIAGNNIIFDRTNLALMNPHKMVFSNETKCVVVFVYSDYENFYIQNTSNPIHFAKIITIVNSMNITK